MQRSFLARMFLLALALFAVTPVQAQDCVGLPSGGRGLLTYGFEGTDGATGDGLAFAYGTPGAAGLLQYRSLNGFGLVNEIRTVEAQGSVSLLRSTLPVCLVAGAGWTGYNNEWVESRSWSSLDPNYLTERHRIGGEYRRFRLPLGLGVGREFVLGQQLSLTPYLAPAVVYENEVFQPENASIQERSRLAIGGSGGLTAAVGWLVIRSTVSHVFTHENTLSLQSNFPLLSVHLGVRF